ncbi:hypothetical protein TcYC6_0008640 [Trypanosoma cruzi]|nr:hypothetical protein TcYC6_0008640 [Trypanosoma cruzi]
MRRRLGDWTIHGARNCHLLWHTDLLTCFTTSSPNKWRSTIRQDTHRYLLCGTRPSESQRQGPITQEVLHRQELVHLGKGKVRRI